MLFSLQNLVMFLTLALVPLGGEPAAASIDETDDQQVIIDSVKAAIDARDYRALSAMEAEFRNSRARTVSGIWKLSIYHWRVKTELGPQDESQCDDRSADFLRGWASATPHSPAPHISRAAVLEALAWCHRGNGPAGSVGPIAFAKFHDMVEDASDVLAANRAVASADPHFYAVMERIAIDQGFDKGEFRKLLDEATAREPDYHYTYFDAYRYYQPQWFGSDEEIESMARYALTRTTRAEGTGIYARYYWFALDCNCGIEQSIDWPTMKKSMRDVMARYPSDWNAANFARISCTMRDFDEARNWLTQVKGDPSAAWSNSNDRSICLSEARPKPTPSRERCPYAAIEGWSAEDFDRYCRS